MPSYDLIIRNGTIVDGTGAARFTGDVAVKNGLIAAVGKVQGDAAEEIDAAGKVVTPGFVDIHTHYDGQATWDQEMAPSSWHGVTTVVMGNCGVGFAPARPDRHGWLIGLMEGVEDIPGTALAEGMTWNWETFPEYLDELERLPRTVDVGTHVPHGAVRAYVLGDREQPGAIPTEDDIRQMAEIVEDGVRAGALGFSTSRTVLHRSIDGEVVPGTTATKEELIEIGRAMGRAGHGVFEMASDMRREWDEFGWMGALSRETGLPCTYAALQSIAKELPLEEQIAQMRAENDNGANIVAQIALRGNGIVMAWQGTVHPFRLRPSWQAIAELPWEQQRAKLLDPAFKAQLLSETNDFSEVNQDIIGLIMVVCGGWTMQYEMDPDFDYEPQADESIAARAAAAGVSGDEYAYDLLCQNEGKGFIYLPLLNYADGNLDFLEALQASDDTVNSLSDGGAHCGTICDAASPTFMLQHWVRDRKRGGRISLERAVQRQCRDTARLYGLEDRGVIAPGYLADLNVIDLDKLKLGKPWLAFDLPAGGKRLLQKAEGYVCTIKNGAVTFRNGEWSGATPGGLIRGPQRVEMLEAAE
ncbi:D-aminoacylase [Novosphingobium sp.]|jgi:N-acyl-D-aspartate/D-glutamate deacylase|uniref:N-acyl-D-amino-acid deacylase family protein n=1 Tax=Novosphingobium sp. TaxID=1874826 RepID=UPI0022BBD7E9|nr:D-aminoacylase [Novosphingobium sp.]MCZ8017864.1 D-aminoacylase [Novosphingobium sp.]MCZ8033612.1 D-aminoacylase [Novosphingobium sp.]MCZ8050968.1 D-aminoacylase [Novosphingobium sp.]MCZ8059314.1 D-aminoacylase [Novosphingobium sp.]MCZ8231152.1 D-aminoacylase [Novosphingobium sp.]